MINREIQHAINSTSPNGWWEEKVDWQKQEPANQIDLLLASVVSAYTSGVMELDPGSVNSLIIQLEERDFEKAVIDAVKLTLQKSQLGTLVSYCGSETIQGTPDEIRPPEQLIDLTAMGV